MSLSSLRGSWFACRALNLCVKEAISLASDIVLRGGQSAGCYHIPRRVDSHGKKTILLSEASTPKLKSWAGESF